LMPLKRSSLPSNRRQAARNTPAAVHSPRRRQHVVGLGYRSGKSCQRAPLVSTHSTPSKQGRGGTRGRPPCGATGGCGNKSAIRSHCSSERYGFGAVLDPVQFDRRRGGQYIRVMIM
jgi:hypothetical protein